MKNLFYKEMKLSMHPLIWVFMVAFPLLVLIPSYPIAIGFIYLCPIYPILFLGANKGQQSNDIYFTSLLPIKKRDIVKARMMTVLFIQLVFVILTLALSPISMMIRENIGAVAEASVDDAGLSIHGAISAASFAIVGYAICDLIYLPIFFNNGRSVVLSTLLGTLDFTFFISLTSIVFPYVIPGYREIFEGPIWLQLIILSISILISALFHFLTYKLSANRFEKVDL